MGSARALLHFGVSPLWNDLGLAPVHANGIATIEELSAVTVHEINQPVAALVTNAQAALRFLARQDPNLDEVRHALTRVLQLGDRIVEIVGRTRALVHRLAPRKEDFELNEAIQETISLNRETLLKNNVSVHTRFTQGLLFVRADRVQLQQVILNLITNAVEAMSAVSKGARELRAGGTPHPAPPNSLRSFAELRSSGDKVGPAARVVFEPGRVEW